MVLSVQVRCPAKVNLFLAVGPKDKVTGYHPIRTIFQAIGLFDFLEIERATTHSFECNWPEIPQDTTVTKALRLLREFGDVPPLRLSLSKSIPYQAGLGGGSSNAAGLLRAINQFSMVNFSSEVLFDVACAVGADVPFFLIGGRAKGEGFGEILTPLEDSPTNWLVIVKPDLVGCSTPETYARLDEHAFPFREFPTDESWSNDFERVMPSESARWIEQLKTHGAIQTVLCGSGSAVAGVFDSQESAVSASLAIKSHPSIHAWAIPTLSRIESLRIES